MASRPLRSPALAMDDGSPIQAMLAKGGYMLQSL